MVTLPRTINYSTGKNSMHQTGFSDATWGNISCSYTQSACGLGDKKFSSIIDDAQVFMKRTCAHNMTTDGTEANNLEEDEWACLSSSKSGCESIHFTSSPWLTFYFRICTMVHTLCMLINPHSVLLSFQVLSCHQVRFNSDWCCLTYLFLPVLLYYCFIVSLWLLGISLDLTWTWSTFSLLFSLLDGCLAHLAPLTYTWTYLILAWTYLLHEYTLIATFCFT